MKKYELLDGRTIAIDGKRSVYLSIVTNKVNSEMAIHPADADKLVRHIVDLLNGEALSEAANAKLDARIKRVREANTYRGRVNAFGEERVATIETVRSLLSEESPP